MFAERFRLRRNWLNGYCNVRTFEGHMQGEFGWMPYSLIPRLVCGRGEKTLVHTVCACSVFPGFLGIWKFP